MDWQNTGVQGGLKSVCHYNEDFILEVSTYEKSFQWKIYLKKNNKEILLSLGVCLFLEEGQDSAEKVCQMLYE